MDKCKYKLEVFLCRTSMGKEMTAIKNSSDDITEFEFVSEEEN